MAIILGLSAVFGAAGCGEDRSPREESSPRITSISLNEVYARMENALDREEMVVHTQIQTYAITRSQTQTLVPREETWIEIATTSARSDEYVYNSEGTKTRIEIVNGDLRYSIVGEPGLPTRPRTCRGASGLISTLLNCAVLEESSTRVETGATYDGQAAIVLATEGTFDNHNGEHDFSDRLYINESTWLPIAAEFESEWFGDDAPPRITVYENEFVPRDSLPADHFDAVANGWTRRDPEADFREALASGPDFDVTLYWLGPELDPDGPLPPLRLDSGYAANSPTPHFDVSIDYELAEIGGSHGFVLHLYTTAMWQEAGLDRPDYWWNSPHAEVETVAIDGGIARIYRVPQENSHQDYIAHVFLGDTLVRILHGTAGSPYDTPEGMRAIVLALHPFE